MAAALLLAIQVAAATPTSDVIPVAFDLSDVNTLRYDLDSPLTGNRCLRGDDGAIVVCGRREAGAYPMEQWALIFPPELPLRAETSFGDDGSARGGIYIDSVPLDRGAVSNRAMVGIAIAF